MSIINSQPLIGASGQGGYFLTKSLRFRQSASAYLNRTPASNGTRTTWTWSAWVKRGTLGSQVWLFGAGGTSNPREGLNFDSNNNLNVASNTGGSPTYELISSATYRDPSAWYHIVYVFDSTQATSSNRIKLYVNGVQLTAFGTATYPSQNANAQFINSTSTHTIGGLPNTGIFDGYMAEINFIDGQALTPSSFGETSTSTGVWIPKKYTGTYGTNGFYLPFTDVATTSGSNAGLGKDFSGNGNYWTTNNISVTSGSTYDSMKDVPTLTDTDTANYAVLNPVSPLASGSITNGNLTFTSGAADAICVGTIGVSSGKYYWEITATNVNASLSAIGIIGQPTASLTVDLRTPSNGYCYISNGNKGNNNTTSAYGATYTSGDVIGVALDMDAGTLVFYKNNSSQGTAYSSLTGTFTPAMSDLSGASSGAVFDCNFGQRPFAYTPPTGFKALNTFNLPTPTIGATASSQANKYMDISLYSGNGTSTGNTQVITNTGGFQPDFVWIKARNSSTPFHILNDSVRGTNKILYSNSTDVENSVSNVFNSFNSNGFTVDYNSSFSQTVTNQNGQTYVGWQWRASNATAVTNTAGSITSTVSANQTAGFSIVTYTGNGTVSTVGHGLGVAPNFIIIKCRSNATNWFVGGSNIATAGNGTWSSVMEGLNTTSAVNTGATAVFNSTAPTSSVVTLGTEANANGNGRTFVMYCWAEVAGYSKFGSYTGNGSSDGTFVFTGFRPRFILIKATASTGGASNWRMIDTSRTPYNGDAQQLNANTSDAEDTGSGAGLVDVISNGFKIRTTALQLNSSGVTFIYMAFAESPFKFALAR